MDRVCVSLLSSISYHLTNYSILTAPTFRFVIGKERKVFNVPTTLFEHVSEPLHTMATSQNFVEGRAGEVVIEDCKPEVFAAVCEFAYTASFDDPDHSGMLHEFKGDERLGLSSRFLHTLEEINFG